MHHLSAIELNQKFVNGELKAEAIVSHFLERIHRLDPQVKAFLAVLDARALKKAKELDQKRARGEKLGRLAGVPIGIKDNIHIAGEITTCASKFLTHYKAPFDATVVRLLEEEDACLIGKTNLDEFAMGSSCENSALQKTHNPWNLKTSPGGSSGGSGAAVAARMVPIALGSDTGGSVRLPASFCGIIGFKPTYGRVSRYGLVAYGSSLDQIGTLTTNSQDAALVQEILGRHCEKDSTSLPMKPDVIQSHFNKRLEGLKVGVAWEFVKDLAEEPKKTFMGALETLKSLGATLVDINLSTLKYSLAVYYIVACAEASTNLARFDGIRYGLRSEKAKTLEEVYDLSKEEGYGAEVKRRIMLGTYVLSKGYQDAYYKKAQKVRRLMLDQYKAAFQSCDLIASPVSPFAAFEIGSIKDPLQMYLEDIYTISINLAGLPAVSVPAGFTKNGLPMGLQLIGPQTHDAKVLQASYAFEQTSGHYQKMPELAK